MRFAEPALAALGAVALAVAFPKTNQAWLAPLGAAALFWAWGRLSWKRAFFTGWLAGTIFFAIMFSWFSYAIGSYVGNLAFAVILIPALIEGLAFALTGALVRLAAVLCPPALVPLAGAAAFTLLEWLRSIGVIGLPFAQIGYSQTSSPLAVFAAYIGAFGVTFVVMLLGAYIAHAIATRRAQPLAVVFIAVAAAWGFCFWAWPARHAPAPHLRVAAVQGNIAQSIKWNPQTLPRSIKRYTALTRSLAPLHPALIVWPETVITADLSDRMSYWDGVALTPAQRAQLRALLSTDKTLLGQFSRLSASLKSTLVVGSLDRHYGPEGLREYNALYTYDPRGALTDIYDKEQLVPFVESLPAPQFFSWIPHADLIGRFGHGTHDSLITVGSLRFSPLICWESAFADIVHTRLTEGAQFLVIPTDDAWFGKSSGTYQHAQIAQMRAIESGEWVIQSASTGVSGIIAPDGRWMEHTRLDREAVVVGNVGAPAGSFFARIGPTPVALGAGALYLLVLLTGFARRRHAG